MKNNSRSVALNEVVDSIIKHLDNRDTAAIIYLTCVVT